MTADFPRMFQEPTRGPRAVGRVLALLLGMALVVAAERAARGSHLVEPPSDARTLLAASGVAPDRLDYYIAVLDALGQSLRAELSGTSDARGRARAVHAMLHNRVLLGHYKPSASDIGAALDGGPFNCAAATGLFVTLARACGLDAHPVSVRGHVWCRVSDGHDSFDVETTCRTWFDIADRYAGMPTADVSDAMAEHRRRVAAGRVLSDAQFMAIFHYNQGVTLLRQQRFTAAAAANRRALALDPDCLPAQENLAAAESASP